MTVSYILLIFIVTNINILNCLAYVGAVINEELLQIQIGLEHRKSGMSKLGLLLIGGYGGNDGGRSHLTR